MKSILRNGIVLLTACTLTAPVLAQTDTRQNAERKAGEARQEAWNSQAREMKHDALRLVPYHALTDVTLKNAADQEVGTVSDITLDPRKGTIGYAAVSFGGWWGLGDKMFAVPLCAIDVVTHDKMMLNVTKKEMENAEGFTQDKWPLQANNRWRADQGNMRKQFDSLQPAAIKSEGMPWRASDIVGMTVRNQGGEELGSIEKLYIDTDNSRVCYAVLAHGGWFTADERFAIPFTSFDRITEDGAILNVTREQLETAPRAKAEDANWNDPKWVVTVYEFHGQKPYWKKQADQKKQAEKKQQKGD